MEARMIGLDLAKNVFQAHGADAAGAVVFRKRLRRSKVLAFFAIQPACQVAIEACAGAHYWGRAIGELGHTVRLIPPAYVKPFLKWQKNDAADAEAICKAAQRPTMRFVAVKSEEQQASVVVFRARDLLVQQRTQTINALRGHLAEYGLVVSKGPSHIAKLIAQVEDPQSSLPQAARLALSVLVETLRSLEHSIKRLDVEIARRARERGRDFAAWLGLTPLQRSTGGKQKLGAISKMGERTLRRLLIIGASAVTRQARRRGAPQGSWLARMFATSRQCL